MAASAVSLWSTDSISAYNDKSTFAHFPSRTISVTTKYIIRGLIFRDWYQYNWFNFTKYCMCIYSYKVTVVEKNMKHITQNMEDLYFEVSFICVSDKIMMFVSLRNLWIVVPRYESYELLSRFKKFYANNSQRNIINNF
jgi:hypothetical protein